ncbi:MAG: transketolase C-terminal domain-containing protein, partial [Dokdonella sp.]
PDNFHLFAKLVYLCVLLLIELQATFQIAICRTEWIFSWLGQFTLDRNDFVSAEGLRKGAYVLSDATDNKLTLILIASGSEVGLILAAAETLRRDGFAVRCVSMPSWELFDTQTQAYRDEVLPPDVPARLAVELGVAQGWQRYVGDRGGVLGVNRFGASAPAETLLSEYGFTVENVVKRARELLSR